MPGWDVQHLSAGDMVSDAFGAGRHLDALMTPAPG
jgi:hypothetical protein